MTLGPAVTPEVSLILPTQGVRPSLAAALRSALAQDVAGFEVVVVDDSVTGPSWRGQPALTALLADPRVKLVARHRGAGCAAAKNAGWSAAAGHWICYLDDDNTMAPDRVAAQLGLAKSSGSPVVLCGFTVVAGGRRRQRQTAATSFRGDALLLEASPDTNVIFHRRDAAVRWDEELGTVDDACLFQALVRHHGLTSVPNVPRPLVTYFAHGGVRANRGRERFYRGQRRLLVRWSRGYSRAARRLLLLRSLVALTKYRAGGWRQWAARGCRLLREGGLAEWRRVANAAGVKIPLLRRWLVT